MKAKEAVDALIKTLKDENSEVRKAAAHTLSRIGDEKAIKPLTEALKDERTPLYTQHRKKLEKYYYIAGVYLLFWAIIGMFAHIGLGILILVLALFTFSAGFMLKLNKLTYTKIISVLLEVTGIIIVIVYRSTQYSKFSTDALLILIFIFFIPQTALVFLYARFEYNKRKEERKVYEMNKANLIKRMENLVKE